MRQVEQPAGQQRRRAVGEHVAQLRRHERHRLPTTRPAARSRGWPSSDSPSAGHAQVSDAASSIALVGRLPPRQRFPRSCSRRPSRRRAGRRRPRRPRRAGARRPQRPRSGQAGADRHSPSTCARAAPGRVECCWNHVSAGSSSTPLSTLAQPPVPPAGHHRHQVEVRPRQRVVRRHVAPRPEQQPVRRRRPRRGLRQCGRCCCGSRRPSRRRASSGTRCGRSPAAATRAASRASRAAPRASAAATARSPRRASRHASCQPSPTSDGTGGSAFIATM